MKFELIAKKDGKECDLSEISTETFENLKSPKPELRHGDYGYNKEGDIRLQANGKTWGCIGNTPTNLGSPLIPIGNIFDDLERNKVDL